MSIAVEGAGEGMVFVAADRRPRLFPAAEVDVGGENIVRSVILAVTAGVYHVAVERKRIQVGDDIRVVFRAVAFGCLQVVPEHRPCKPALTRGVDNPGVGEVPAGEVLGISELIFGQLSSAVAAIVAIADSFQFALFKVKAAGDDAAAIISVFIPPHDAADIAAAVVDDGAGVVAAFDCGGIGSAAAVVIPRDAADIAAAADGTSVVAVLDSAAGGVAVFGNIKPHDAARAAAAGDGTGVVAVKDYSVVFPHYAAGSGSWL